MDGVNSSYKFEGINRANSLLPPMPALSAFNFLRNCSYFLEAPGQGSHLKALREVPTEISTKVPRIHDYSLFAVPEIERECRNLMQKDVFPQNTLLSYSHPLQLLQTDSIRSRLSMECPTSPSTTSCKFKRHRSEKKPIPEEQKDHKYFERRRRNNQAAKKSRDARKIREDQVALKATILEHENAILRAQVVTLREESSSLRQMLLHRKPYEVSSGDSPLCVLT